MRWPYILSLFFLAGATLLLVFNILCGATTHSVVGRWYWLEADTSSIPNAQPATRWTNYNSCGIRGNKNRDCSSKSIAYPMSPVLNFGTTQGVPSGLTKKRGAVYFLCKIGWGFLLVGVIFTVMAFLPVVISFIVPSLTVLNVVTSLATNTALFFTALSAALLTAGYIKARNAFKNAGKDTTVGKTMFAFLWASVFLLALSSILSGTGFLGNFMKKRKAKKQNDYNSRETDSSSHGTYERKLANEGTEERGGFFSRNKKSNKYDEENVGNAGQSSGKGTPNDSSTYYSRSVNRPAQNAYNGHSAEPAHAGYNAKTGTAAATAGLAGASTRAAASHPTAESYNKNDSHDKSFKASTSKAAVSNDKPHGVSSNETSHTSRGNVYAPVSKSKKTTGGDIPDSNSYDQTGQKDLDFKGGYAHAGTDHITRGTTLNDSSATQTLNATDVPNKNNFDSEHENKNYSSKDDNSANQGLWATAAAVLGFGAAESSPRSKERDTSDSTQQVESDKDTSKSRQIAKNDERYDQNVDSKPNYSKHDRTGIDDSGYSNTHTKNPVVNTSNFKHTSDASYDRKNTSAVGNPSSTSDTNNRFENKSTVLPVATAFHPGRFDNFEGKSRANNGDVERTSIGADLNKSKLANKENLSAGYEPTDYYASHVDGKTENSTTPNYSKKSSRNAHFDVDRPYSQQGKVAGSTSAEKPTTSKPIQITRSSSPNAASSTPNRKQDYLNSIEKPRGRPSHNNDYFTNRHKPTAVAHSSEFTDDSNYHTPAGDETISYPIEKQAKIPSKEYVGHNPNLRNSEDTPTASSTHWNSRYNKSSETGSKQEAGSSDDYSLSNYSVNDSQADEKTKPGIIATTLGLMGITNAKTDNPGHDSSDASTRNQAQTDEKHRYGGSGEVRDSTLGTPSQAKSSEFESNRLGDNNSRHGSQSRKTVKPGNRNTLIHNDGVGNRYDNKLPQTHSTTNDRHAFESHGNAASNIQSKAAVPGEYTSSKDRTERNPNIGHFDNYQTSGAVGQSSMNRKTADYGSKQNTEYSGNYGSSGNAHNNVDAEADAKPGLLAATLEYIGVATTDIELVDNSTSSKYQHADPSYNDDTIKTSGDPTRGQKQFSNSGFKSNDSERFDSRNSAYNKSSVVPVGKSVLVDDVTGGERGRKKTSGSNSHISNDYDSHYRIQNKDSKKPESENNLVDDITEGQGEYKGSGFDSNDDYDSRHRYQSKDSAKSASQGVLLGGVNRNKSGRHKDSGSDLRGSNYDSHYKTQKKYPSRFENENNLTAGATEDITGYNNSGSNLHNSNYDSYKTQNKTPSKFTNRNILASGIEDRKSGYQKSDANLRDTDGYDTHYRIQNKNSSKFSDKNNLVDDITKGKKDNNEDFGAYSVSEDRNTPKSSSNRKVGNERKANALDDDTKFSSRQHDANTDLDDSAKRQSASSNRWGLDSDASPDSWSIQDAGEPTDHSSSAKSGDQSKAHEKAKPGLFAASLELIGLSSANNDDDTEVDKSNKLDNQRNSHNESSAVETEKFARNSAKNPSQVKNSRSDALGQLDPQYKAQNKNSTLAANNTLSDNSNKGVGTSHKSYDPYLTGNQSNKGTSGRNLEDVALVGATPGFDSYSSYVNSKNGSSTKRSQPSVRVVDHSKSSKTGSSHYTSTLEEDAKHTHDKHKRDAASFTPSNPYSGEDYHQGGNSSYAKSKAAGDVSKDHKLRDKPKENYASDSRSGGVIAFKDTKNEGHIQPKVITNSTGSERNDSTSHSALKAQKSSKKTSFQEDNNYYIGNPYKVSQNHSTGDNVLSKKSPKDEISNNEIAYKNKNPYREENRLSNNPQRYSKDNAVSDTIQKNRNPYREEIGEVDHQIPTIGSNALSGKSTQEKISVSKMAQKNRNPIRDESEQYSNERGLARNQHGTYSAGNNGVRDTSPTAGEFSEPGSPIASHYDTTQEGANYRIGKDSDAIYGDSRNPRSTTELPLNEGTSNSDKGLVEIVIEKAKNII